MQVQSLGWEDPLEEGVTTHSSILAWRISWTEKPGRLQSRGWPRVEHDWSHLASTHAWENLLGLGALSTLPFSPPPEHFFSPLERHHCMNTEELRAEMKIPFPQMKFIEWLWSQECQNFKYCTPRRLCHLLKKKCCSTNKGQKGKGLTDFQTPDGRRLFPPILSRSVPMYKI